MDATQLDDFDNWFCSIHEKKDEANPVATSSKSPKQQQQRKSPNVKDAAKKENLNNKRNKSMITGGTVDKLLSGKSIMDTSMRERAIEARARAQKVRAERQQSLDHSTGRRYRTKETLNRLLGTLDDDAGSPLEYNKKTTTRRSSLDVSSPRVPVARESISSSEHTGYRRRSSDGEAYKATRRDGLGASSHHSRRSQITTRRDELGRSSHHAPLRPPSLGAQPRDGEGMQNGSQSNLTNSRKSSIPDDDSGIRKEDIQNSQGIRQTNRHYESGKVTPPTSPEDSSSTRGSATKQNNREGKVSNNVPPSPFNDHPHVIEMDKESLSATQTVHVAEDNIPQSARSQNSNQSDTNRVLGSRDRAARPQGLSSSRHDARARRIGLERGSSRRYLARENGARTREGHSSEMGDETLSYSGRSTSQSDIDGQGDHPGHSHQDMRTSEGTNGQTSSASDTPGTDRRSHMRRVDSRRNADRLSASSHSAVSSTGRRKLSLERGHSRRRLENGQMSSSGTSPSEKRRSSGRLSESNRDSDSQVKSPEMTPADGRRTMMRRGDSRKELCRRSRSTSRTHSTTESSATEHEEKDYKVGGRDRSSSQTPFRVRMRKSDTEVGRHRRYDDSHMSSSGSPPSKELRSSSRQRASNRESEKQLEPSSEGRRTMMRRGDSRKDVQRRSRSTSRTPPSGDNTSAPPEEDQPEKSNHEEAGGRDRSSSQHHFRIRIKKEDSEREREGHRRGRTSSQKPSSTERRSSSQGPLATGGRSSSRGPLSSDRRTTTRRESRADERRGRSSSRTRALSDQAPSKHRSTSREAHGGERPSSQTPLAIDRRALMKRVQSSRDVDTQDPLTPSERRSLMRKADSSREMTRTPTRLSHSATRPLDRRAMMRRGESSVDVFTQRGMSMVDVEPDHNETADRLSVTPRKTPTIDRRSQMMRSCSNPVLVRKKTEKTDRETLATKMLDLHF